MSEIILEKEKMKNDLIEELGESVINVSYFENKVEELARLKIERNEAMENINKGFNIEENSNKFLKSFNKTKEIMRQIERELL